MSTELETWQRALDSPRGIIIRCDSRGQAVKLRQNLYKARDKQRTQMRQLSTDDPRWGKSYYESITCELASDEKGEFVRMTHAAELLARIEEL